MTLIFRSRICPAIDIEAKHSEEIDHTERMLDRIKSKPVGFDLLSEVLRLSNNNKKITIYVQHNEMTCVVGALTKYQSDRLGLENNPRNVYNIMHASILCRPYPNGDRGEGVGASVSFNPDISLEITEEGFPVPFKDKELSFIPLAHELIHAIRMLEGEWIGGMCRSERPSVNNYDLEEEITIGLGKYENGKFTENKIRNEHGLPERKSYHEKFMMRKS